MSGKGDLSCKVYVGNLGSSPPNKEDVEDVFGYYGKLANVWIARSPPGFAYITFENEDDAKDACAGLDGKQEFGQRIKVEMAHGKVRSKPWLEKRYVLNINTAFEFLQNRKSS